MDVADFISNEMAHIHGLHVTPVSQSSYFNTSIHVELHFVVALSSSIFFSYLLSRKTG